MGFEDFQRVEIKDWRVTLLYRALQFLVVVYILLIQLLLDHGYAVFESPVGLATLWPASSAAVSSTLPSYCSNTRYDWGTDLTASERKVVGEFAVVNASCRAFSPFKDSAFFDDSAVFVTQEAHSFLGADGSANVSSFLLVGVEEQEFNLRFVYTTSTAPDSILPKLRFLDREGTVKRTAKGGDLITGITVKELLDLAQVSLDDKNPQSWFRDGSVSAAPFYRVSGGVFQVRFSCSNRRQWEWPRDDPQCDVTVRPFTDSVGMLGVQVQPDSIAAVTHLLGQTGIIMRISTDGQVGQPSLFQVVQKLVEGIVLLSVARTITHAAMLGFPLIPPFLLTLCCCSSPKTTPHSSHSSHSPHSSHTPPHSARTISEVCGCVAWAGVASHYRSRLLLQLHPPDQDHPEADHEPGIELAGRDKRDAINPIRAA